MKREAEAGRRIGGVRDGPDAGAATRGGPGAGREGGGVRDSPGARPRRSPRRAAPPAAPRRSPRRAAPPAAPRRSSRYRGAFTRPARWHGAFTRPARWHGASARSRPAQRAITPQQWSQCAITPHPRPLRVEIRVALHPAESVATLRHRYRHSIRLSVQFVATDCMTNRRRSVSSRVGHLYVSKERQGPGRPNRRRPHGTRRTLVALGALMCVMCHMPVLRCRQAANT